MHPLLLVYADEEMAEPNWMSRFVNQHLPVKNMHHPMMGMKKMPSFEMNLKLRSRKKSE